MNIQDLNDKMKNAISHFEKELSSLRTSRANPKMWDSLLVVRKFDDYKEAHHSLAYKGPGLLLKREQYVSRKALLASQHPRKVILACLLVPGV